MALFSNHSMYPDGQTIADSTPQLSYICDRSQFAELSYDIQFRIDDAEVYVSAGASTLWSDGTGGSRDETPPDTIFYTLTTGQSLSNAVHTFKVYHKHNTDGTWLLEVSSSFTVFVYTFSPPVPSGLNNMITVRRLVAAAANKIYYEDV